MRTGAVILAAGHKSSRTSFQPMLPIGETTAIKRMILTLDRAGVDPVVVITGERGEEVEKHVARMRVICLRNENYESAQMFDSVCIGLNYIEDLCDRVLVMPAKVPMLLAKTIERIMDSRALLACPVYEGRRGHPVMIAGEWIPKVMAYEGIYGLGGFLRQSEANAALEEVAVADQGIIDAEEADEDCAGADTGKRRRKLPLHSRMRLYLECDQVFFGPGIAQFLTLIDHTGSMQTACRQMHMSYSKGWKIMKTAERELGYPLLITQSGGADGGHSQLTHKTKDFLSRFLKMEEEMNDHAKRLFKVYFEAFAEEAYGEEKELNEGII